MKQLSTVLEGIKHIANESEQAENILNIQEPISMENTGLMNIQNSSFQIEQQNMPQLLPEERRALKILISENAEDKKKLTALVKACYESLNTYGKSAENLEAVIMLMQITLGRFEYETVRAAFGMYLQHNTDMPKPADIIKIIEPPKEEKKWCKVTFLDIKRRKRENQFVSLCEDKYCDDFIRASVNANSDDREELNAAIKQAQIEHNQYWND